MNTPIRTDSSNAFAHNTIHSRIPAIIRETQALNPNYPDSIHRALDDLHDSLVNDAPIQMLDYPAPDYEDWLGAYRQREGETWQATDWFFAEIYVYRLMMQAVRWWETGRDPFAPKKAQEYASDQLWELLGTALAAEGTVEERLFALLEFALWGNRIDLSYALAASHGSTIADDDLLVDERAAVIERLLNSSGPVHIIADNAGTELTMDLVLADMLLADNVADRVFVHLKWHPTFVSDAIVPDVITFFQRLESGRHGQEAAQFGQRLRLMLEQGRLRLAPDPYWNSTRYLSNLPHRLQAIFDGSKLAIIKGDANYRRMVSDTIWQPETPLREVIDNFPCPLVAMRTLKSDPVVGLPARLADKLDAVDDQWRVNGRRGVLQTTVNGKS